MPFCANDHCVIVEPEGPQSALASRKAAAVRNAVRKRFPRDERYLELFSEARRGDLIAAFEGEEVVGILLAQSRGRDAFHVSSRDFTRLYGTARGLYLYVYYRASQQFPSAGDRYIASIWIAKTRRGEGLGGRLLEYAMNDRSGRWSVNARRGGSERFFARAGFAPRRGMRAALVRWITGCEPMEMIRRTSYVPPSSAAPDAHQVGAERTAPDQVETLQVRQGA
ncbi:MAG: GNAT family N-acetyltransferase [Pseudomonadota bacterium]